MRYFYLLLLSTTLVTMPAIHVSALEMSAAGKSASEKSSFQTRLTTVQDILTAAINDLKARVDALEADLAALTARVAALEAWRSTIDTWKASVEAWQTSVTNLLNNHATRIAALEGAGGGGSSTLVGTYSGTHSHGSGWNEVFKTSAINADMCVLTKIRFDSVQSNHAWGCRIDGSPGAFRLAVGAAKSTTICEMTCYNF